MQLIVLNRSYKERVNSIYESTEDVYEDVNVSAGKKKGKADGVKKRKGPPKSKSRVIESSYKDLTILTTLEIQTFDTCTIVLLSVLYRK